jgi:hypothetical protein
VRSGHSFANGVAAFLAVSLVAVTPLVAVAWSNAGLPSEPDAPVAAIFPPWWNGGRALAAATRAGGRIIAVGGLESTFILAGEDPGLAERLRHEGAWLILGAEAAAGCSPRPRPPFRSTPA